MISVKEAEQIINSIRITLPVQKISIEELRGQILAEPVYADRDLPPYNRVTMDGIAVNGTSLENGTTKFPIDGIQPAGSKPMVLSSAKHCIHVMTGAVLPEGTDTVIPVEYLSFESGNARLINQNITRGANVHRQGSDVKKGDCLLNPGTRLTAAEAGVLAATGHQHIRVFNFPPTAVISTGDELVDIREQPEPWQIRRSNTSSLQTAMRDMGWSSNRFHFKDNRDILSEGLRTVMAEHDIIILSGGVSKGDFDFIPAVLEELGIQKHFHQIAQRPGKPFWFGTDLSKTKIVFALPGNPVSTFLNFYRYIKPWMEGNMGMQNTFGSGRLSADCTFQPALTYFLQVKLMNQSGIITAKPVAGGGSGDFSNLLQADAFMELPADRSSFAAGESFPLITFR